MSDVFANEELDLFRALLAREFGLHFEDDKLTFLATCLRDGMGNSRCKTAAEYFSQVVVSNHVRDHLARSLTVSETYFFRDQRQFEIVGEALRRAARHEGRVNALSAGCSSGEEAYTLAIVMRENLLPFSPSRVQIHALDLNPDVLDKARAARYRAWSLRDTPPLAQKRYFSEEGPDFRLDASITELVHFQADNLANPRLPLWAAKDFDFIFCRNVLMYLTVEVARQVVDRFWRMLRPGGRLFLGHAETLRGISDSFQLRHENETFCYERRDHQAGDARPKLAQSVAWEPAKGEPLDDGSWFDVIEKATSRIRRLSEEGAAEASAPVAPSTLPSSTAPKGEVDEAFRLMGLERFEDALRIVSDCTYEGDTRALLLRAMLLVCTGRQHAALSVCRILLQADDANAGAYYVLSICEEFQGDLSSSVQHSRTASRLDATFAMPRLQIGRLARRARDVATAKRELESALMLLAKETSSRIVLFGGGFSRDSLMDICRAELKACEAVA